MIDNCKRCLLEESGKKRTYESVRDYLNNLSFDLKVSDELYSKRLDLCKTCNHLISGMCLKCGCYVQVRAALKDRECPNHDDRKW